MFVELSILELMRKNFHHVRKCEKRLKIEMGKGLTAASWRLLCPGWPPRLRTVLLWTSSASLSSAHQPAFRIFSNQKTFLSVVKKKRTFLEALWQSPASLSLAQQLLLFCLGPEKDPDKSCDMVFYHELRSSHSFLFDLVSKSTVEKSDTFFSRQIQSWIIFRNLKIIIKNMKSTGTGTISMDI